jgi:hypothetical protein
VSSVMGYSTVVTGRLVRIARVLWVAVLAFVAIAAYATVQATCSQVPVRVNDSACDSR